MRPRQRSPKTVLRQGVDDSVEAAAKQLEEDKYFHGGRSTPASLGVAVLGLFGVSLLAAAATRLHGHLQGRSEEAEGYLFTSAGGSRPKDGLRERIFRRQEDGERPLAAGQRPELPKDHLRGWVAGAASSAPQQRPRAAAASASRFKLVPRPQYLEVLHSKAQRGPLKSANISLWWATKSHVIPPAGSDERIVLDAFQATLGVAPAPLGTTPAPLGSVAVSIQTSLRAARESCAELVGYTLTNHIGLELHEDCHTAEWHFVLRWRGRTAVCATRPEGAFRFGSSTLAQMHIKGAKSSADENPSNFLLEDWPHHCWRGLHLDTVRHWMPVPFVKQYIRAMAIFKANFFHWHLTDDQAWRLYLPSRPKLVEAQRRTSPNFYSQDDIKEVLEFAKRHFVTVVPGIEMPGHVIAALSVYPELACHSGPFHVPATREGIYKEVLCVGKAATFKFAVDVFTDVAEMFPSRYIHVGGDEATFNAWQESEHVRAFAGMTGLRNLGPDILEAWFCAVGKILKELGKQPIMWDDHFENRPWCTKLCPHAEEEWIVQSWNLKPPIGDGVFANDPLFPFRTISSPVQAAYLDYPLASTDFNKTLNLLPLSGPLILGGCATMWTEDSEPSAVGAKVYPRYLGIAERLWGGIVDAKGARALDEDLWTAAKALCSSDGLLQDLGFPCGQFEPTESSRNPVFKNAIISTSMDSFGSAYAAERAIDTSDETYFWAVSPKAGDHLDVSFRRETHNISTGCKWLGRLSVKTGSKDRPGDQLLRGLVKVMQWVQDSSRARHSRSWVAVCSFEKGVCDAPQNALASGPISAIRILVTSSQEKWIAMPSIAADEVTGPDLWLPSSDKAESGDSASPTGRSYPGQRAAALDEHTPFTASHRKKPKRRRHNITKLTHREVPLEAKPTGNLSSALRQLGQAAGHAMQLLSAFGANHTETAAGATASD